MLPALFLAAVAAASPAPRATVPPCAKPFEHARLARPSTFDIPPDAVPAGVYRDVHVNVILDATGRVKSAKVIEPSGSPKLDAAVLQAARTSSYVPRIYRCKAIASTYFYIVQYGSPPPSLFK